MCDTPCSVFLNHRDQNPAGATANYFTEVNCQVYVRLPKNQAAAFSKQCDCAEVIKIGFMDPGKAWILQGGKATFFTICNQSKNKLDVHKRTPSTWPLICGINGCAIYHHPKPNLALLVEWLHSHICLDCSGETYYYSLPSDFCGLSNIETPIWWSDNVPAICPHMWKTGFLDIPL